VSRWPARRVVRSSKLEPFHPDHRGTAKGTAKTQRAQKRSMEKNDSGRGKTGRGCWPGEPSMAFWLRDIGLQVQPVSPQRRCGRRISAGYGGAAQPPVGLGRARNDPAPAREGHGPPCPLFFRIAEARSLPNPCARKAAGGSPSWPTALRPVRPVVCKRWQVAVVPWIHFGPQPTRPFLWIGSVYSVLPGFVGKGRPRKARSPDL